VIYWFLILSGVSFVNPNIYIYIYIYIQSKSFGGGSRLIIVESCNNLLVKTKFGNTVYIATLAQFLPDCLECAIYAAAEIIPAMPAETFVDMIHRISQCVQVEENVFHTLLSRSTQVCTHQVSFSSTNYCDMFVYA
jgi:hypothetical protein